jgi:cell division protein FtsI/penicillin-binding protein 2
MRRVPFGQEISVTALQLAMAFATLCNGGELLRPRLVEAIAAPDGTVRWRSRRELVRRLLDRPVAAGAVEAMRQVVESDGGTGRRARMDRYTCFGKTGTAQIAGPGGYEDGAYVGSFIAAAPVDEPRLLCLISIYWPERSKGYYGGVVAAPYVKDVLQRSLAYLDVPPDKPDAAGAER